MTQEEQDKINAYADVMSRRDRDAIHYGTSTPDAGWLYGVGERPSTLIWPVKDTEK